ncbi:MAG: SDR family NAD(P)-dependent oxidoreductase [Opitutales bacterium]|jgi:3-oxoacyl-[acyl-carrier protein] reductase|nr:3-oxoacyl-ACP reductase FabG [Opitutae bacterium]NBU87345.1 3-oxoacyl-ACP reductase FabG [Verrucomicrobiota bacterium]
MPFSLLNKVALVTGSSRGLGRGIALALGKAGAKVCLNYLNNSEAAEGTLTKLREEGIHAAMFRADASDKEQVESMIEAIEEKFGSLDILVPNATPDQPQKPIEEYDADFYRQMYDFFVVSPFHLAKAVLPGMKKRKSGRIINITSEVFHSSVPEFSAYVAAKGGQIGWSRSMASELASFGITVNTVAPGWIPTERHENDSEEVKNEYLKTIPLGRWGTPEDVGNAVVYYSSDEASFVTGQTLCVNGGRTPW